MKRLRSWLTRPFRRNRGRTPIYPEWEMTGSSWTLPDFSYTDGPPLVPGADVHLGKRWGQGDIDKAAAEGRLTEHMAEHGFYPEGEEPT